MISLTEEQKSQNVAALRAAYDGKPWQWRAVTGQWLGAKVSSIHDMLRDGIPCRPTPEPEPPRPWDMTTCPPLPFEVIHKNKERSCVLTAMVNRVQVGMGTCSWPELLIDYKMTDGSPCGVQP